MTVQQKSQKSEDNGPLWTRLLCTCYQSKRTEYYSPGTNPRGRLQTLLLTVCWHQSLQGKHNTLKHWMDQHSTYIKKGQSKISSNSGHWSLHDQQVSPSRCRTICLCAPLLCHSGRSPAPSLRWRDMQWGWPGAIWHICFVQSHVPTQGYKLNTGCVGSLSLGKEVSQAQSPFWCSWEGAERLCE